MNINFKDPRVLGIGGAVLLALTSLLPWFTLNVPLLGALSVSGFKDPEGFRPDGIVAVALAAGIAFAAWKGKTLLGTILSVAFLMGCIGEYVYAMTTLQSAKDEMGGGEFGKAIADAITLSPGIGLILGALVAVVLAVSGVLTYRASKTQAAVVETHEVPA